jgi:hypothetical protein
MALKAPSFARLKLIHKRQHEVRWGAAYQPAIEATSAEAPSLSRASILAPQKLGEREMHVLSPPERAFALLALHHPHVVDIHEQKMLSVEPRLHPLTGFPGMAAANLPPIKGLIDVADRLGYVHLLPLVREEPAADPQNPRTFVFPYVGDLLPFIWPPGEQPYCINWNIKDQVQAFKRPGPLNSKRRLLADEISELPRNEMERVYYADADVRTEHLALEQIDPHVVANLTRIFLHEKTPLALSDAQRVELRDRFSAALAAGISPLEVIQLCIARGRFTVDECRTYLWQTIWRRELRCDLFKPVLINRPLRPETVDILDVYGHWFRRVPCTAAAN